jgi:hypothetical protein
VPASAGSGLQSLLEQLGRTGDLLRQANDPATIAAYSLQQANVLVQIIDAAKPEEREPWFRQLANSLATAAMSGTADSQAAYRRLAALKDQLAQAAPGSDLAAHVAFLEFQADARQAPEERRQRLAQFVEAYPRAEDTPAVLAELARGGASLDAQARARCRELAQSFPENPQVIQACATLRRLELPGQTLDLTLPFLNDPTQSFHAARLAGQVVVVYCWSSADTNRQRNCEALGQFLEEYGGKGLGLVMVNLDKTVREGQEAWQGITLPAVQLYAQGGLAGAWARDHGVTEVPTVFLVERDGRVASEILDKDGLVRELQKRFPGPSRDPKP